MDRNGLVAQRDVIDELKRRLARIICDGPIEERRRARSNCTPNRSSQSVHTQPVNIDTRTAGADQRTSPDRRLDRHQNGAIDRAAGVTDIGDARGIQIDVAVAIDIDADLDFSDQLHEIDDGLASAVASKVRSE